MKAAFATERHTWGGEKEVQSQKRHGMAELTAAVGAMGHREPEVVQLSAECVTEL